MKKKKKKRRETGAKKDKIKKIEDKRR